MADDASLAATVREHFEHFLMSFSSGAEGGSADLGDAAHEYLEQCHAMRENERSTLFVDYQHIEAHDSDLSDAIKERFYELEPHLRVSVRRVVASLHEDYAADRDFHVSFFNLPHISALRELRTDRIASLSSFAATVTRTSDVRPELLHGFFQCEMCSTISEPVAQQFKYTQPIKCKNPTCVNRSEWQLRNDLSKFVDWQRLRVQARSPLTHSIAHVPFHPLAHGPLPALLCACVHRRTPRRCLRGRCLGRSTSSFAGRWWSEPRLATSASSLERSW